jgi:hypothetical protein
MDHTLGTSEIAIQGERVLRFINCTQNKAVFKVIGFKEQTITVIDYRQSGLIAIQDLLNGGELYAFAPRFNTPAKVSIQNDNKGNITIQLDEPGKERPSKMLWIVIGLEDSIPNYDYLFEMITPLDDGSYGYVAYFNIPDIDVVDQSVDFLGCEYSK